MEKEIQHKNVVEAQDLNEVLSTLPKDKRAVIESAFLALEQRTYSGPLPAPEDFAGYEATLPGATDRILKMTEAQVAHRIETEKKIVKERFTQSGRGQWLGFILCALFGAFGLYLGATGHDILAGVIFGTTILSIAVVFVLNQIPRTDKQENVE